MNKTFTDYTLVSFPAVQDYIQEDWFQSEAILYQATSEHQDALKSAYFVPNQHVKGKRRIANGLAEVQSYLSELTDEQSLGKYHEELHTALQDAIDCMQNY